jgi:hypothetical protein
MKRTSDAGVMFGAVAAAGALLLGGAAVASALLRMPAEAGAAPGDPSAGGVPARETPAAAIAPGGVVAPPAVGAAPSDAGGAAWPPVTAAAGALSPQLLVLAAEKAPFDPERQAPAGRYLFPEERVVEAPPPEPPRPPDPPFRVVGAVSAGGQSVAVVEAQGQAPKVLRVGEELLGFRVKSVEGNVVVVSGQGWDLTLPVEALQPVRLGANTRRVEVSRENDRDEGSREEERARERALEAVRERLEGLSRQMQQSGQGPVRVEMQGDRAIIVGPNGVRREIQLPGGGEGQQRETIRVVPGQRIQVRPGGGR